MACSLWLAVSRSMLAAWSRHPEVWRLELLAVDRDPGAILGPSIAHDLELQANGLKLGPWRVLNFYCELFHLAAFFISFMSSLTSRRISSIASAILFNCFVSIIFLSLTHPIISGTRCQACGLLLGAFFFHNFFWPSKAVGWFPTIPLHTWPGIRYH